MEIKIWCYFMLTEFLLSITPGPAVLLISTQGLKYGAKPSYFGSIGITTGNAVYFILSALGLGTIILAAGNLFEYIKILGALYLIGVGISMFYKSFKKQEVSCIQEGFSQNNYKSFLQGFITQVANPKAIIFFVALLPQFIDPTKSITLQFLVLGISSIIMETFILMFYGWLAAKGKKMTEQNRTFSKWQDRISGSVLVGLGINLFFIKRKIV